MKKFLPPSVVLMIALFSVPHASALERSSLLICGDAAGWPPYHFSRDEKIVGYDVDILQAIFSPMGISIYAELPPWQRCLQETKAGNYDIAISASYNEERDRNYILSDYYYTLQPSYIYSSNTFPNGPPIYSSTDINNLRACGLHGYSYTEFGIDDSKVRRHARTFTQLVNMLEGNRCDIFLARYEVLLGFKKIENINHLSHHMKAVNIPGIEVEKFYMLISRQIPDGDKIKSVLNSNITTLRETGRAQELLSNYFN